MRQVFHRNECYRYKSVQMRNNTTSTPHSLRSAPPLVQKVPQTRASSQSLACPCKFNTHRKNREQTRLQTTFSTQNERWQGAMCVRRMIKKAHALRLANSLILCYGLRSFHRPSVPPSRVVNMITSFTRKPMYL